jgi:polysaccharide biosynthesis protein PslH
LKARGHDITVLVPRSVQNDRTLREVVTVLRPRVEFRGRILWHRVNRVRRITGAPHWDAVVVSHHESWWLLPKRQGSSSPTLLDVHNVMSYWHTRAGRGKQALADHELENRAVVAATAITTCSRTECRRLEEMHPEVAGKTFAAPLGVDPSEWPEKEFTRTEAIVALFGTWGWRPNSLGLAWFLKEVWPRVHRQFPEAVALIAGSDVDGVDVWPDGARFVGRVDDLAAFTASATVLAVPVLEGVGASVKFAEALASGAAVVATPDGANAFDEPLAYVSADPEEWADWIVERLRRRLQEAAPAPSRAVALHDLTWDAAVAPIDEWLRTVASQPDSVSRVSS